MSSRTLDGRFRAGTIFARRYELKAVLGTGGTAEVYAGWDQVLRRRVAVKVLWAGFARDPGTVARFEREARAAASLSHPNIVSVFDLGVHRGDPFIVMELLDGRGLDDLIWQEAPLAPDRAAWIADGVAAALASSHAAGVVHRDVKPANVVITDAGGVKVLDFGIARATSWTPLTTESAVQGTPHYVAPELVLGHDADARADLYSLGAVLYEMLVGRPPFTGESVVGIAHRHVREEPVPVRQWNRSVPAELETVVMRCLAKDPARRYQRADALREDLRTAVGNLHPTAPSSTARPLARPTPSTDPVGVRGQRTAPLGGPPGRTRTPTERSRTPVQRGIRPDTRRRRWPAALVAVALVATAAAAGFLLLRSRWAVAGPGTGTRVEGSQPPAAPLLAPTDLQAIGRCDGFLSASMTVSWRPPLAGSGAVVEGFELYRAEAPSTDPRDLVTILGADRTRYVDRDVHQHRTYTYWVKTSAGGRTSFASVPARADTPTLCLFP
jgi:eukaryotic-like serine/threonine-protein kinase